MLGEIKSGSYREMYFHVLWLAPRPVVVRPLIPSLGFCVLCLESPMIRMKQGAKSGLKILTIRMIKVTGVNWYRYESPI